MAESMLFLHDLQLLELSGAFKLRYYIAQFQFCICVCCGFFCLFVFVFFNICIGDLCINKILSTSSKKNEKVALALKNCQRLDVVVGWIRTSLLSEGYMVTVLEKCKGDLSHTCGTSVLRLLLKTEVCKKAVSAEDSALQVL